MMRFFFAAALLTLTAACGGPEPAATPNVDTGEVELAVKEMAGAESWSIDRAASSVRFRATQNAKDFEGSFARWNAGILLNPQAPQMVGEIEAIIDLSSVDAGDSDRNKALPEEGWFNTALHPTAIFKANDIQGAGDDAYVAAGTLTIKGITRDVAMPFVLTIDEEGRAVADGTVVLDRSQFGVGSGEFAGDQWVGLEVEVLLHIEAVPGA